MHNIRDGLEAEWERPLDVPGGSRNNLEEPPSHGIPARGYPVEREVVAVVVHTFKNSSKQEY